VTISAIVNARRCASKLTVRWTCLAAGAFILTCAYSSVVCAQSVSFGRSVLSGTSSDNPTTLMFGPDDRLYVGQQNGLIKIYSVVRDGPNDYSVVATETLSDVRDMVNHNDNGVINTSQTNRQVTGLWVTGTAANPVLYVSSSDPRIAVGEDSGLDTNSGILSRLTFNGSSWDRLDLVRGLPRSEENHSSNGMYLDEASGTLYLTQGGHTNMGAPSINFGQLPEYALSAAILSIDLSAIGESTYDIPTLDDPTRPNTGPGGSDNNDPFGGNDGLNQAMRVPGSPVQVYASGFRNPYDVIITESGRMYTIDNGPNNGWGGPPVMEGPAGDCTNGSNESGTASFGDSLHFVTGPGYYGGHPNPTRANMANTFAGQSPVSASNPVECDYRQPGAENGALATWGSSVNGLAEYTASNFGGSLQGSLIAAAWNFGSILRVDLNASGDTATSTSTLFSGVGSLPLDVIAQGDGQFMAGTIWVAVLGGDQIVVYEPADLTLCSGADDPGLDEDLDGYDNADELDNDSDPCSAGSIPPDFDQDLTSDINDPDDDDDGIADVNDPFAIDPFDGLTTVLPIDYGWGVGQPGFGLLGLGFTGHMINGSSDYLDLFDPLNTTPGGAAGKFTIDEVPQGDAFASSNDQEYGFQFGINVTAATGPFTAVTAVDAPFFDGLPQDDQSLGVFIGSGDQDNYVELAVAANGGAGGVEVTSESGGVPTTSMFAANVLSATSVELMLSVDPAAGTVQPRFALNGGTIQDVGPAISLSGDLLTAVQSDPALAVGVISTSSGATPFTATWDFLQVVGDPVTAEATVTIDPPGSSIDASTFGSGSFIIDNDSTGGEQIMRVSIDFRSAMLPDLVFDPDGVAGDVVAKPFTSDSGASATGLTGHTLSSPHDDGFDVIEVTFDDFGPGETFTFSIDVDPTSIRGANAPGPNDSGSVSGLELAGSQVIVEFDDGTVHINDVYRIPASLDGTEAPMFSGPLPAPGIEVLGVAGTPAAVSSTNQTVRITGPAGSDVNLLQLEGGLFTTSLPGGGFDIDPFEANSIIAIDEYTATIGGTGFVDIPVTLSDTDADGGINHLAAVLVDGTGRTGAMSETQVLALVDADLQAAPSAVNFGSVSTGDTPTQQITLSATGETSVQIDQIDVDVSPPFSILNAPALPVTLNPGGAGLDLTIQFAPESAGVQNASLTITHTGNNDPLTVPLSGTGSVTPPPGEGGVLYRVNCGGAQLPAADGSQPPFAADTSGSPSQYVNTGSTFSTGNTITLDASVPASTPMALFQTERFDPSSGPQMQWDFPVDTGTEVQVRLYFAEIYSGITGPGQRVFDVQIEGNTTFTDVDAYEAVGFETGYCLSTTHTMSDNNLDIDFIHNIENPSIKGIEIRDLSAIGPSLVVTPTTLDFSSVGVGSASSPMTVTLLNTTGMSVVVDELQLNGAAAGDFAISAPTTPFTIADTDSETVDVTFSPTSNGLRLATLRIVSADIPADIDVVLSGTGVAVPPPANSVLFRINCGGPQIAAADSTSPDWAEDQATNNANGTAQTGTPSPYVNAAATGDWAYGTASPITLDGYVAPSAPMAMFQTHRFDAFFAPTMQWDFPVGANRQVEVRLYFAEIFFDQNGERVFDVLIEEALFLDNEDIVQVSGGPDMGYMVTTNATVGADGNLDIDFVNDVDNPAINGIEILGPAEAELLVSTNALDFSSVGVGMQSPPQTVTIINTTGTTLTVDGITLGGNHPGDFDFAATGTPFDIGPASSADVDVTFMPTTNGARDAVLSISSPDMTEDLIVSLFGTGVVSMTGNIHAVPPAVDFGAVDVGTTSMVVTVTLTNTSGFDVMVTTVSLAGAHPGDFSAVPPVVPFVVADSGMAMIDVTFAPLASGLRSASLDIITDTPGADLSVPLTGTGVLDTGGGAVLYRVNCGGPAIASADASLPPWSEDQSMSDAGGTAQKGTPSPYVNAVETLDRTFGTEDLVTLDGTVPASAPMELFQTERWDAPDGAEMEWDFPVSAGSDVAVRLYFAESFWGLPDRRDFDVEVEGILFLVSFDIFAEVGHDVGTMRSMAITVSGDGNLDIDFFHGMVDNPIIKGIEIIDLSIDDCTDGNVNLADYAKLADCHAGPDTPPSPSGEMTAQQCLDCFDIDLDGDIDLLDVAEFAVDFNG